MAKQQITLSPEALAALRAKLPLEARDDGVWDRDGLTMFELYFNADFKYGLRCEIAAALAQLINAAFIPAAEPAPESNAELRQAVAQ